MPIGGFWTSQPTLARHLDNHLEVFAVGVDGNIYRKHQIGPDQGFVADWTMMDPHLNIALHNEELIFDPLTTRIGYLADGAGRTTIFARTVRGRTVYAYTQPGGWTPWHSLAAVQDGNAAIGNPVGLMPFEGASLGLLFTRGRNSRLLWKERGNGLEDWGDPGNWSDLGGTISSEIAAAQLVDDPTRTTTISLFVRGHDHDLYWNGQTVTETDPDTHGRPFGAWTSAGLVNIPGARLTGNPIASGPFHAVWRGENGSLWTATVDTQGRFSAVADLHVPISGDPAVAARQTTTWTFWRSLEGRIMMRRSGAPSALGPVAIWSGTPAIGDPAASVSFDGRPEVVFLGADGQFYHLWEIPGRPGTFGEGP
jgi:hypothetical protein